MSTITTEPRDPMKREHITAAFSGLTILAIAAIGVLLFMRSDDTGTAEVQGTPATAPAAVRPTPTIARTSPSERTIWVVDSQASADLLHRQLGEADVIRANLGEQPLDNMVVFGEEAEQALARTEENRARAAAGLPAIRVIDTRRPAPLPPAGGGGSGLQPAGVTP